MRVLDLVCATRIGVIAALARACSMRAASHRKRRINCRPMSLNNGRASSVPLTSLAQLRAYVRLLARTCVKSSYKFTAAHLCVCWPATRYASRLESAAQTSTRSPRRHTHTNPSKLKIPCASQARRVASLFGGASCGRPAT